MGCWRASYTVCSFNLKFNSVSYKRMFWNAMHRYLIQAFFLWTMVWLSVFSVKEVQHVCYPHIGCFSQEAPWTTFIRRMPPPQSPKDLQIKFYIMTRNTKHKSVKDWKVTVTETFRPTHRSLRELDFQVSRPRTAFHIHGMFENNRKKWIKMKELGNAYLSAQDVNIVFVAWDAHTIRKGYLRNVSNCRVVGAVTAKFIENLIDFEGLTPDQIHIVGFSLGAHVAGYVGKRVPDIYRITALDAAQPGFENADPEIRLHYTDAQYVDAFHTNARSLYKVGVGYRSAIGDVDFYFNGGAQQPGCFKRNDNFSWTAPKAILSTVMNGISRCSHMRAIAYWIEALENRKCTMWGTRKPSSDYVVTKETLDGYGITPRSVDIADQKRHLRHECTPGNCLPVGLQTFNLDTRGVFHVATGSNRNSFCIPRDEHGDLLKESKKPGRCKYQKTN